MAQVPNDPSGAVEQTAQLQGDVVDPRPSPSPRPPPPVQDGIAAILQNVQQMRARLLKLRKENAKEYDRVLRQGYPLDVLTLIELLTVEAGNRTMATMVRCDELADAIETAATAGDEGLTEEETEALRVVLDFVDELEPGSVPVAVKAAVAVLREGGLIDEDDEDDEDGEPEVEPAGDVESNPEGADGSEEAGDDREIAGGSPEGAPSE